MPELLPRLFMVMDLRWILVLEVDEIVNRSPSRRTVMALRFLADLS